MNSRPHSTVTALTLAGRTALLAALLAVTACGKRAAYSHFEAVDYRQWNRTDTLHFTAPLDTLHTRDAVRLDLRVTAYFPYMQLTLVARQHARVTGCTRTDTVTIDITDGDGKPQGSGSAVRTLSAAIPLVTAAGQDTVDICINHAMNRQRMPGITDVGITVE